MFIGCQKGAPKKVEPAPSIQTPVEAAKQKRAGGDRYRIDAAASQFTARIGAAGALSVFGHEHFVAIREFSGEARLTPGALETGSLQVTINAGSLAEAGPAFSDADRKKIDHDIHEQALELSKYPQIVFSSTSVSAKKLGEGQ